MIVSQTLMCTKTPTCLVKVTPTLPIPPLVYPLCFYNGLCCYLTEFCTLFYVLFVISAKLCVCVCVCVC